MDQEPWRRIIVDRQKTCTKNACISALKYLGIPLTGDQKMKIHEKRILAIPDRSAIEGADNIRDTGTDFYNSIVREYGFGAFPILLASYEEIRDVTNSDQRVIAIILQPGRLGKGLHAVHVRDNSTCLGCDT